MEKLQIPQAPLEPRSVYLSTARKGKGKKWGTHGESSSSSAGLLV